MSYEVAHDHYLNIGEMMARFEDDDEGALEDIYSSALLIQIKSSWTPIGQKLRPTDFEIKLTKDLPVSCTKPRLRLTGQLDSSGMPFSAVLQFKDFLEPWMTYLHVGEEPLLSYARCFYYGEKTIRSVN